MSNLSALEYIQNRSEATTGLFNQRLSVISANFAALNSAATISFPSGNTLSVFSSLDASGNLHAGNRIGVGVTPSADTVEVMTIGADSSKSDYILFHDPTGAKSSYVIGSRVGGTADGLNIYDASGSTMIASFSKQSIRFYQQVVGPVFDLGGALTGTYNAATFGTAADSKESRIQAAINQASTDAVARVYVPQSMLPYSASSVSFVYTVQMVREGGNPSVDDVLAYGATGTPLTQTPTTSSTSAIQAAINTGRPVDFVGRAYRASNLSQSADEQILFSSSGLARIVKDVNGSIISCRGAGVQMYQLEFRGDTIAVPVLTGNNVDATGNNFSMINCGSRWAQARAVKSTGGHTQIIGTCDVYQTADATATGYDIELGVSGTATLYHELIAIYTSQAAGGILMTDVGGAKIIGGQVGKVYIKAGTLPAGVGVNSIVGVRLNGNATTEISSTIFSACAVSAVTVTMAAATSGCVFDLSNAISSGGTVINNGNTDNLIIVPGPVSGGIRFPGRLSIPNTLSYSIASSGGIQGAQYTMTSGDNLQLNNLVSGKGIQIQQTGTGVIQQVVNSILLQATDNSSASFAVPVQTPTGTALAPTQAFVSETSLGWFRSGNSSLGLSYGSLRLPLGAEFLLVGAAAPLRAWEASGDYHLSANRDLAFNADNAGFASWIMRFTINAGANNALTIFNYAPAGGANTVASLKSNGAWQVGTGTALYPTSGFLSEISLGLFRSGVSRMGLSYGQFTVPDGSNTTPSIGLSSATSVGFYSSGVQTIAQSLGTLNLATNSVRLSMRTIAASALTASAANTNVAVNEVVFTIQASGASFAINSGGTTWLFNSDASAKNT